MFLVSRGVPSFKSDLLSRPVSGYGLVWTNYDKIEIVEVAPEFMFIDTV